MANPGDSVLSMAVEPDIDEARALIEQNWHLLGEMRGWSAARRRTYAEQLGDLGNLEDRSRREQTGRYPLELLQNANDAASDAHMTGHVQFAVTKQALLVGNDGARFTSERIRSLMRISSSEKAARPRRTTVGYKGVGFNSAFEISDTPQVITSRFSFGFDRVGARREVNKVLGVPSEGIPARHYPRLLEFGAWALDADIVTQMRERGAVSIIRLPLRAGTNQSDVDAHIKSSIVPATLLFLPAVAEITFLDANGSRHWKKTDRGRRADGRLIEIDGGDRTFAWIVRVASTPIDKGLLERLRDPLWTNLDSLDVSVAVPWSDGAVDSNAPPQPLYSYFPTDDQWGRPLLIHGDFYIDAGRRHIETRGEGGEISRAVAREAVQSAVALACSLSSQGYPLLRALSELVPAGGFGQEVGQLLLKALSQAPFLRTFGSGTPRRPDEIVRLNSKPSSVALERRLLKYVERADEVLMPGDDLPPARELMNSLAVTQLQPHDLGARIDPRPLDPALPHLCAVLMDWLNAQSEWQRPGILQALRARAIWRDEHGNWCSPNQMRVPIRDAPLLPQWLRPRLATRPARGRARELFDKLSIAVLDERAGAQLAIDAVTQPKLPSAARLRDVYRYLKEVGRLHPKALTDVARLGQVPVPTRDRTRQRRAWTRADATYFGDEWVAVEGAEALYGRFGAIEFLDERPPRAAGERRAVARFLATLGVAAFPRSRQVDYSLPHFSEYAALPETVEASQCPQGHSGSPQVLDAAVLDRLDVILDAKEPSALRLLARVLAQAQEPYGQRATYVCDHSHHRGRGTRRVFLGYQRWRLETTEWVPVTGELAGGPLRRPSESWYRARTGGEDLLLPIALLEEGVARRLALNDCGRPSSVAVARALDRLSTKYPDLSAAAMPVMRTTEVLMDWFDQALQRTSGWDEQIPPMAGETSTGRQWSRQPLVNDLHLTSAPPGMALLPFGRWHGLRRALDLPRVSERVEITVRHGKANAAKLWMGAEQRAMLLALLERAGGDRSVVTSRLRSLAETRAQGIEVTVSTADGWELVVPRSFFLQRRRDKRGRLVAAHLYVGELSTADQRALAADLADYL
ncbi:MAG TPA: hypothetical protein VI056_14035, partial [Candidatus Limnocylindria bacterium]